MKVLVTGAAGRVGSHVCRCLHEKGHEVRATDVVYDRRLPVKPIVADLLSTTRCYELLEGMDAVVHLGNHPHPRRGAAQLVFSENCRMNINVFQAALEMGILKVVFASSVHACRSERSPQDYQSMATAYQYLPLDGEHPACPANTYGLSKAAGELTLRSFCQFQGLRSAVALRLPLILSEAEQQERRNHPVSLAEINPYTRLDELFGWLSAEDTARLVEAVLRAELPGYRCYAPAHPKPRILASSREIIEKYFAGVPLRRPVERMESLFDLSRIQSETGWWPKDDLRAGSQ